MKIKHRFLLLFSLLALAALLALAPLLLQLDRVQLAVAARLEKELHHTVRLADMGWRWKPLPCLLVRDLEVAGRQIQLRIPEVEFRPDWLALLRGRWQAGKVVLRDPVGRLHSPGEQADSGAEGRPSLPEIIIQVKNGRLTVPAPAALPAGADHLELTGLDGSIDLQPNLVLFDGRCATFFSRSLQVQGEVHPADLLYRLQVSAEAVQIHKIAASLAGGRIIPQEAEINLRGEIKGRGLAEFRVDLDGELPCLLLRPDKRTARVECGQAAFSLLKTGSLWGVVIKKIELQDPQLLLTGKIVRTVPPDAGEPHWQVDLQAQDLNLGQLREKALSFWPESRLVRKIASVVRGGSAPVLGFRYEGNAAGLADPKAIVLDGLLEQTALLVPEVELSLSEVSGGFALRNGELSGSGLKARLGGSTGWNGSFLLGLAGPDPAFRLELDLKADVADLPGVLHKVTHHARFLEEVDRFQAVAGSADGHLRLGDRLHDVKVEVAVNGFSVSGRYDRLPWPFAAEGGLLQVDAGGRVDWRQVRGTVGPHRIGETAGAVSWGEGELPALHIEQVQAELAAGPLFQELKKWPAVGPQLAAALSSVDGRLRIGQLQLAGPARSPGLWEYSLAGRAEDLKWTSPLLADAEVTTARAAFSMAPRKILLQDSQSELLGDLLQVQGNFEHQQLRHWRGWARFKGTVTPRLAAWVREREWVPAPFFPRPPVALEAFRIGWGEGLAISGGIRAGDRPLPRADFDLRLTDQALEIKRFELTAAGEHGLFALQVPDRRLHDFRLDWRGLASASTLDALLADNRLLTGTLAGTGTLHYTPSAPRDTRLVGTLAADNLQVPRIGPEPFLIRKLQMNGSGSRLDIPILSVEHGGETIAGSGTVEAAGQGLDLDFSLRSPSLSWETISGLRSGFLPGRPAGRPSTPWDLRGRIAFAVEEFRYTSGSGTADSTTYRWRPLAGDLRLHPAAGWQVDISRSDLCGIGMTGTWSSEESVPSVFRLATDPASPPSFQEVMPCLGMEQDLILGQFDLEATLEGTPGRWTGGRIRLDSGQGNIRRLTLLSNIFKVVNLTDFFTDNSDLPDPVTGGLPYSGLGVEAAVKDDRLLVDKAVVRGEGLNLFGSGEIELSTRTADLTILIAPFKTIDSIVSRVPIIGRVIGGKNATLITIPVALRGPFKNPSVILLPPEAVGEGILNLVKDTLTLPFTLLGPIFSAPE